MLDHERRLELSGVSRVLNQCPKLLASHGWRFAQIINISIPMATVRRLAYPLQLGNGVTRALDVGAKNAPCVLLLHGLGARADRWARNLEAIAAPGLRALAVDLPGHGFASKGRGFSYAADAVAHDLQALLRSEGQSRVSVVGTSLGGLIAMRLALLSPDRSRAGARRIPRP